MKILFLTPCIPTASDGRRPYNFLSYLAPRHEVHLFAFRLPCQTPEDIRRIQAMGVKITTVDYETTRCLTNCAMGIPLFRPMRVSWCHSTEYRLMLERILQKHDFDVVHIDRMRMGQYATSISIPKLVDFTDSLVLYLQRSIVQRKHWRERWIDRWEFVTIPRFERWLLKRIQAALVCSSIDAKIFQDYHPLHSFPVIENAVDTVQFAPRTYGKGPRCVLTGTLFYFANIDSVQYYRETILPALRKKFPSMETILAGTRPTREIRKMNGKWGIQLLADVPRMEEILFQDDIYVCPLRVAAGVRNKLLEAMAAQMPIVTTRLGVEGMCVEHEKEVLFAETPDEFVQMIQRLMNDPSLRKRLGEQGRNYVMKYHALPRLGEKLEELYNRMIQ